jgi:hypothetical protein
MNNPLDAGIFPPLRQRIMHLWLPQIAGTPMCLKLCSSRPYNSEGAPPNVGQEGSEALQGFFGRDR